MASITKYILIEFKYLIIQITGRQDVKMMIEGIADSDVLLNRVELERMLEKARLEGAIGYITFLCQALNEGKIRTLDELDQIVRDDWGCACSAVGQLMMKNLLFDGYATGLMANIKPKKIRETEKQLKKQ
jgi:hypothetical protein